MITFIKVVEYAMYGVAAFGVGAALAGIYSVALAFSRKQDRLLEQRFAEKHNQFLQRKQRIDRALGKNK